ncbi:MAG: PAS domain S-box protein [Cellvibrio sp.]|uniref:PAS domain S-box protein n=1 Tax=Cellvibrio sp. TaxID=1965322 RepID=UPI002727DF73|nr:PAS domain S-box protein [Cellvibrio sp.]
MTWLFELSLVTTENSHHDREAHFKELAETISEVFWLTDISKGKMLYISPGYERIWGRSCELLYENPAAWLEPIHPDDKPSLIKALTNQALGHYHQEYRIIRPDGNIRWIEDRAFPIRDKNGDVYRIAGVATDITHRKHIEQRLRQQESRLHQAARIARLGSWSLDIHTNKISLDDEVCKVLDLPPNSFMPQSKLLDMYPPRWRKVIEEAINCCIEDGTPYDEELQIITAGGGYIWIRTLGEAIRDQRGEIVRLEGSFQDITEQKHAATLLAQGGQRLQQLANALPIIIWSATSDGTIDYVNNRFIEYTGIDQAKINNQREWLQVVHHDDRKLAADAWKNATQDNDLYLIEFRLRQANGNYRWHLARAVAVFNSQHEVVRWYGSAIDIHDTKTNEEKAQALADRLTVTLESITDAFVTMNTEWKFTYINQEAEQLLRRSRAELLGKTMWAEFPQTVDSDFEFQYKKAATTGEKVSFEAFYAPLTIWFSVNAYPSSEGLAIYFQDITLRRKNEQQLRLMETCIAHMNDMVIITTATPPEESDPEILFVNPAFEKLMGYTLNEVINKPPPFLRDENVQQSELDKVRDALKNRQPVRAELTNSTKSGDQLHVEMDLVPIADDTGNHTHWIAVERNVTERKRIAELEQAHQLAELSSQAKSDFLAAMSHEIRTPINGVIGMIDVLQQTQLRAYQIEMVDIIHDSAMSLLNIIEDILDFSKIEAGRLELESLPFSPANTFRKAVQLMEPAALYSNVTLQIETDNNLPNVLRGDEQRLRQILLNLISNAIKFSSKRKPKGIVSITTVLIDKTEKEVEFEIRVKDNGIGLSKENQTRLFKPFVQADASTSRHFGGTGLGLSITHGLIELMQGSIHLVSELDQGAEFTVRLHLPVENSNEIIPPPKPTYLEQQQTIALNEKELPILVVEDNSTNQKVIVYQLELLGYNTDIANNGEEALEKWRNNQYSLILTDLHMPELNGYELVKKIRSEEILQGTYIPIIALTANALRGEAERCLALGMDDYLTKPITLKTLTLSLAKTLHSKEPTTESVESVESVDINVLVKLVGADALIINDFLSDFLQSSVQLEQKIMAAYEQQDWPQLSSHAHTLKSSARAVGAMTLGNLCNTIENHAKKQDEVVLAKEIELFTAEFNAVTQFIKKYVFAKISNT